MKKENGFSLVEMMIAATILAIVGAASIKLLSANLRAVKQVETHLDLGGISQRVRSSALSFASVRASVQLDAAANAKWLDCKVNPSCTPGWYGIALGALDNPLRRVAGNSLANAVYFSFGGEQCEGFSCLVSQFPIASVSRIQITASGYKVYYCLALRDASADLTGRARQRGILAASTGPGHPSCSAIGFSTGSTPHLRPSASEFSPLAGPFLPFEPVATGCPAGQVMRGIAADGSFECMELGMDCATFRYSRSTVNHGPPYTIFTTPGWGYWGWAIASAGRWTSTSPGSYATSIYMNMGGGPGDIWGVQCLNGYRLVGCSLNGNLVSENSWVYGDSCLGRKYMINSDLRVINATCCKMTDVGPAATPPPAAYGGIYPPPAP